ncbi:acyl-CoA dehydrogenase family protein [Teichococcus aestuarii]|uniref:Acyl-CoA dehydrogenase n=1 Tax=Teichococcus aestuarii TaxID=568898 RepID=A0A2U1V2Q0_9PROT|nr:acyl-CoA dehydrogenase family protein [Pseudoroseomonas aestuarii]PWC28163.1 acyl-CoA dehydrogenase [Pseudoroseomonas aestuarii]
MTQRLTTGRALAADPLAAAQRVASLARALGAARDADGAFPDSEVAVLHDEGLLLAPLPAGLGGAGLLQGADGLRRLARVLAAIGAGSLPLGRLYEGHVNALGLIQAYGTEAQRAAMAEDVRAGHLFGVWATDDGAAPLRLEDAEGGGVLRGRKILASGAGRVTRPLVTARAADGLRMVLPHLSPRERADLSGWTAQGMRASATGAVDLEGLPIATRQCLGAPEQYLAEPHFAGGAWRFLAVQSGGMAEAVALLREQLRARGRDADPYQLHRAGEAAIALGTARLWVDRAAALAGSDAAPDAIAGFVNLARRAVERAALEVLEAAQRSVGLMAFMRPQPLERVARDLATYLRQPAPDRALAQGAAHWLERDPLPWP